MLRMLIFLNALTTIISITLINIELYDSFRFFFNFLNESLVRREYNNPNNYRKEI